MCKDIWNVDCVDSSPVITSLSKSGSSSTSPEQCPCAVVFAQNLAILEQSLMPHVSCLKHS